ncbi:hypothetical protein GOA89_33180 [Sinorhizobium meliloti]|nr:hypothetical protein [Sinorhizobium meliloti]MDW9850940.1 hypothetical protein [Sinorhizobium meliloti]MDX0147736.1 hypothetical protein [Sinorhizobium meliloti]MDX0154019.1 hypothetical protein [Sinorhizobium meliloti]MDX0172955.1 hypothetical protein [Sinorhizobium meliloti]
MEEEKLAGSVVGFGLNLRVATWDKRLLVVAEHEVFMPWQEAVADFVCRLAFNWVLPQFL